MQEFEFVIRATKGRGGLAPDICRKLAGQQVN